MDRIKKLLLASLILIVGVLVLLPLAYWATTFHPPDTQSEPILCPESAPQLQPGQTLKVLTYNVQFLAGKNYRFFYEGGSDTRPSPEDIAATASEIARILKEEGPDIVLLQEVDDGARRTDYADQLALLQTYLGGRYPCHTSAFYWKADFVPHPDIQGAVGQKISILSKYRIDQSFRYQLPTAAADPLTRGFLPKRALLEARLPVQGAGELAVLATHLEVSTEGPEVKEAEIAYLNEHLASLIAENRPWLLGGDFNLLPPGQINLLREDQRENFRPASELGPLAAAYAMIPHPEDATGADYPHWLTMYLNDPSLSGPDRTVDYLFYSEDLSLTRGYVRQEDTLAISDHLPVIAVFQLP